MCERETSGLEVATEVERRPREATVWEQEIAEGMDVGTTTQFKNESVTSRMQNTTRSMKVAQGNTIGNENDIGNMNSHKEHVDLIKNISVNTECSLNGS